MLVYKITASIVHKYSVRGLICLQLYCAWCTHEWNTPVPRIEYACTTHGICLYHAWNTPVPHMEYAWNMQVSCMKYAYFSCMEHAQNMHEIQAPIHAYNMYEISNYSILLLEISCMKLSGFGRMKCAETCMKHACFRRSILSRDCSDGYSTNNLSMIQQPE